MGDFRTETLAQKYRPLIFKDVLDQESIITVLKNILKNKNFSSPFMFTGLYGGGKTTLARIFARAIMCESITEDFEPCNQCSSCKSFLEESNLSYTEIDAASNSGVDKIRKLREDANFKSLGTSERKVVVIDESQSISTQGNEALLKQLEDSSSKQVYIFCTTAPEKMLDTVRSRCFEFPLSKISKSSISERLEEICKKEKIQFDKDALDLIAGICSPHVRDSLKQLDFLSNFGKVDRYVVFDHFKLNLRTEYLGIIFNLKDNLLKSIDLAKSVSLENDIPSIYEGLLKTIIDCQKLSLGLDNFKNEEQSNLANKIIKIYKINLLKLLEELLKRNRYVDSLILESDLILLHSKLKNGFVNLEISEVQVIETKEEIKEIKKVEEIKVEESMDLEGTSKVLKRYKSYPESLAILMDKGKKSSSLKNGSAVELKQRVRDYKRNLDKDEIKTFLEKKRTIT
ncbi:ATP-binding protein [bacterium]|nr:ATP-binding protein [bacterium]